jgi:hypothetical protein
MKIWVNGEKLAAYDAEGLVQAMHKRSPFEQDITLHEFMEAVAARALMWSGAFIRTDNADTFIADLAKASLVELST